MYPLADNLYGHGYLEQPGPSVRGIMMLIKLSVASSITIIFFQGL